MKNIISLYQALLDKIERFTVFMVTILLAVLLSNEAMGLLFDFFGHSITWTTEASVLLFSWVVFLGAGILSRYGGHIALDLLVERLPEKYQYLLQLLYTCLALIVAFVMVYFGGKMAFFVGRYQSSVYLQLSLFYFYLSVPVGGLLLGLNFIGWLLPDPKRKKSTSKIDKIAENPLY
jgi:C4-dicarboxylate transporter, DctQ subunit